MRHQLRPRPLAPAGAAAGRDGGSPPCGGTECSTWNTEVSRPSDKLVVPGADHLENRDYQDPFGGSRSIPTRSMAREEASVEFSGSPSADGSPRSAWPLWGDRDCLRASFVGLGRSEPTVESRRGVTHDTVPRGTPLTNRRTRCGACLMRTLPAHRPCAPARSRRVHTLHTLSAILGVHGRREIRGASEHASWREHIKEVPCSCEAIAASPGARQRSPGHGASRRELKRARGTSSRRHSILDSAIDRVGPQLLASFSTQPRLGMHQPGGPTPNGPGARAESDESRGSSAGAYRANLSDQYLRRPRPESNTPTQSRIGITT